MADDTPAAAGGAPSADDVVAPRTVVVGVDGSLDAQHALRLACEVAVRFDAELVVAHAVGLMTIIDGEHVPAEGRRAEIARLVEQVWCAPLRSDPQVPWRALLVDGPPADALLATAAEVDAEFIVVGSRGTGKEQVLGSTSHHVVHHTDRPVIVVPPADRR